MDDAQQDELRKKVVIWECSDCENIKPRHVRFMPCQFCGGYIFRVTTLYEKYQRKKRQTEGD